MKKFNTVVIVGSSGSGKTTLVNGLRVPKFSDKVIIPRRYITRPQRLGDDLTENAHIDHATFQQKVDTGSIYPFWNRQLDGGRIEKYGFVATHPDEKRIRIYSANNAFLRDRNPSVQEVLESSLIVVAMARQEARDVRLGTRSPDMSEAEREVRLNDSGIDILDDSLAIKIIDTTNLSPEEGQQVMREIVNELV